MRHTTRELATKLRIEIELTESGKPEQVVEAFRKFAPHEHLADAFWELDSRPGQFPNYTGESNTGWHAKLRVCRNRLGEELFALFRGE